MNSLLEYDERRRILARDNLASVDGFRTLVLATHEYLFGMRVCPYCPDCNNGENSTQCQDFVGSNATPEGGISVALTLGIHQLKRKSRQDLLRSLATLCALYSPAHAVAGNIKHI
jgi:hypothetical protein